MGDVLDGELAHGEPGLVDAGGLCSGAQDVSLVGDVIRHRYPLCFLEEAISCQYSQ